LYWDSNHIPIIDVCSAATPTLA